MSIMDFLHEAVDLECWHLPNCVGENNLQYQDKYIYIAKSGETVGVTALLSLLHYPTRDLLRRPRPIEHGVTAPLKMMPMLRAMNMHTNAKTQEMCGSHTANKYTDL